MQASKIALVLSGGVSLGAYQGGAYARMHDHLAERLHWIAGSSIGAINGAIIAGNEPQRRIESLARFWEEAVSILPPPLMASGQSRRAYNWFSALQTRVLGRPQLFSVRPSQAFAPSDATSLYDLAPLADTLASLVDFDRLNDGAVRLSVITTDIETGEPVVFDTGTGDRIKPVHLIASCGFIPEFEPVEIDGRLLGDGGLVANAPIEAILGAGASDEDLVCFVIDLFASDSSRPTSLADAAERRLDLLLGNQTHRILQVLSREHRLRRLLARAADLLPANLSNDPALAPIQAESTRSRLQVLHLSYRSSPDEAGPEKQFDFSRATLSQRWDAGASDMAKALQLLQRTADWEGEGMLLHRIRH